MMYGCLNCTNVNGAQPTQPSAMATQDFSDRQERFHNVSSGRIHVGDNVTFHLGLLGTFDGDCIVLHSF